MRRTGHAFRATCVVKLKRTMWSSGATLLALLLVFVRPALGDPCVLTMGSQYQLKSDTVDWTMQTSSGQSCIRGLRHKRVTIDSAKLISPPQSGQVKLLGSGFSYTAKSDFEGQDSFTIQVSGMLNGVRGSSDIRIIVSVGPNVSPQTSPTEQSDRPPDDLNSTGQPNQNPTAQGTNQTRQVRPANADTSMSPSTGPARILPSQQDTGPLQPGHRYQSDNWRSAGEARAGITIATRHRAQSDGIAIATEHRYRSDNWRSAGEAHAGITTGHRSERITITIATRHRYQSDNWRWAGEAGQRGHVNAPLGCDR